VIGVVRDGLIVRGLTTDDAAQRHGARVACAASRLGDRLGSDGLGERRAGDRLNLEADVMARYAARLAEAKAAGY